MFVSSLLKLNHGIKRFSRAFCEEMPSNAKSSIVAGITKESKNKDRKKKSSDDEGGKYSATVILPQTTFDQRANSLKREPELQKFWAAEKIYKNTIKNNKGVDFILHDGPPYANGNLHIGHSLNKILKDIINKYQILKGNKVKYVPGWDCHGLPIELKVLQNIKSKEREQLTPLLLRKRAAEFAKETMQSQKVAFQRYGVWGDFENPYLTLQPQYEAEQIRVFGDMMIKGHIYRGKKPVHWSPSSRTALAEAELEYPDNHISRSIYVAFPLVTPSSKIQEYLSKVGTSVDLRVVIWTTTPWTIPANLAVAVNGQIEYCIASHPSVLNGAKLIIARDLVGAVGAKLGVPAGDMKIEFDLLGSDLLGTIYQHPLFDRQSEIVLGGDYITTDSGTGLVHTAPGHGEEDYQTGLKYNLPLLSPVNDEGRFTNELDERFAGKEVLGEGNTAVIQALNASNCLLKEEPYNHKYPYDWRTKKPTIFRATEQWFASVSTFRDDVLKAIDTVEWIPAVGKNRITSMIEGRGDWCISRQRSWGVPIPVFYSKLTNEPLITEDTLKHVESLFREHGSDVWWERDVKDLLPPQLSDKADEYSKGTDTMDVWFDSGTSWAGVVQARQELSFPADVYLEGSDQHRGWFQSSILTSVATQGKAPFKKVITHGFVLDEKGLKMSKSLGNVVDPIKIIEGGSDQKLQPAYGADTLRLWVSGVDYTGDVCVGENIMKQVSDNARKIRNTLRFLVGSLTDFNPSKDLVPYDKLPSIDKYVLGKLTQTMKECETSYEQYQFFRVVQSLTVFANIEVSAFYLDIAKDRLYISSKNDVRRKSCQTVIFYLLEQLTTMLAPIVPHMAEDLWQNIPYPKNGIKSIFEKGWVSGDDRFESHEEPFWDTIRALRYEINKCIELARRAKLVGASQECKVYLHVEDDKMRLALDAMKGDIDGILPQPKSTNTVDDLRFILLTSQIELVDAANKVTESCPDYNQVTEIDGKKLYIGVTKADGQKCQRCWYYSVDVLGTNEQGGDLCTRCADVVKSLSPSSLPE